VIFVLTGGCWALFQRKKRLQRALLARKRAHDALERRDDGSRREH
jgi:hypothetical protein